MAFVPNDPTQDPNKQAPGANPLAQQAPVATSSAPGAGPAAPGGAGQPSSQTTGQPFTNLQAYLTANAPQITQQANTISGNLQNQYGGIQNQIQSGVDQFGQQVQAGYAAPNQDLVNQAVTNPTQFVQNPQNVSAFQSQLNDVYNGPTAFEQGPSYASLNKAVLQGAENANLVNTPEGLQTYLRNTTSNYTPGESLLDQVLLSGSPQAIQQIQGAAAPFKGLPDYLSGQVSQADQGVTTAQQAAQQASQFANQGLQGAETGLATNVQNELKTAQDAANLYNTDVGQLRGVAGDYVTAIQNYLAQNPQLSSQLADLSPWANLQNVNAPTAANAASPYDYAVLSALSQLSGQPFNAPINAADVAQGGTFALPQDLQAAIASGAVPQAMTQELMGIQNQITKAYDPFQQAMQQKGAYTDLYNQAQMLQNELASGISTQGGRHVMTAQEKGDAQAQLAQIQQNPVYQQGGVSNTDLYNLAQGIQWLPGAATGYNDLVAAMNAKLQGLGNLSLPNIPQPDLNQGQLPQAATAGNAAATATGVGAPAAAGLGSASALTGAQAASAADLAAATGMSQAEAAALSAQEAGTSSALGEGALTGTQAIGPAALAAYGASNIGKNVAANPIPSTLSMLGNTGLSLATLSLPPNVLSSIGSGINNVINSIGDFFGGLF